MKNRLEIKKLGLIGKILDILMVPVMYLVSGTILETPQRGHKWNNVRVGSEKIESLDRKMMAHCKGNPDNSAYRPVLFHIPIFGGWRNYVVLEPVDYDGKWHVGYSAQWVKGYSRIEILGPVRMLVGRDDISFFGFRADDFSQISIKQIGEGKIGEGGPHGKTLLL